MTFRVRIAAAFCWIAISGCGSAPEPAQTEVDGVAQLEAELSAQTPEKRVVTIGALGRYGNKETVAKVVQKYVDDPNPKVAEAAREALKARENE